MNEVVLVVDDLKTNAPKKNPGPPNPLPKKSARGEKWKKPSTLIAFAMLALTLLLPVGMVAMAVLTVASNDRGQDLGNGMYMRTDANGIPDIGWQSNRDSALGIAALLTGVCCPLVPYVILMLILITGYFAFRSAGS